MSDENFYKEIDFMFESYLSAKEEQFQIRIKDISKDKILSDADMNYSKVFFDSDLNIYKKNIEDRIELVNNDNFQAVFTKVI
jgi:hypothetical protein